MAKNPINEIINQLSLNISDAAGNNYEDSLDIIHDNFSQTLDDALRSFSSSNFSNDGFISKLQSMKLDGKKEQDIMRNVLNNLRTDHLIADSFNQTEMLMRRDLNNICLQMPEMRDVIYVMRDAIIECNVSTGEASRTITFENHDKNEAFEAQVKDLEKRHKLLMAIKNFIVPNTLRIGEMYINVVPYAKLFAELEAIKDNHNRRGKKYNVSKGFHESVPNIITEHFQQRTTSLYSDENVKILMESMDKTLILDDNDIRQIDDKSAHVSSTSRESTSSYIESLLKNIEVYNGSSVMMSEMGSLGLETILVDEYKKDLILHQNHSASSGGKTFMESLNYSSTDGSMFRNIDQDNIDISNYQDIKGCYIKYLDSLRLTPIRIDRRIVGYLYITTTMDLQTNPANPNGIVDLSYQNYVRDRNLVGTLANMIIKSFDKQFLEKNIKLRDEISEIVMAHKFSEGKLSFVYIPENEVIRLVINEDENGKGHSIIEPSLFSARTYLMLTMYNTLYTLNNNATRVHYIRSSGLDTDYAAQIQRTMRKFQQRRITIDDIYSYSGVLNKIGGMGEMILPTGPNDFRAIQTDTIEASSKPIDIEFLEQQRRQALSGTGSPNLMIINAIDEVDFAKTLEMANARWQSNVSSYKIDFNEGITQLYQAILRSSTDMEEDVIQSFRFAFNPAKQQELNITIDMINNFNTLAETVASFYYQKNDMEDKKGNPSPKMMHLRKELAKVYLPQLNFDDLDDVIKNVEISAGTDTLQAKIAEVEITNNDLKELDDDDE